MKLVRFNLENSTQRVWVLQHDLSSRDGPIGKTRPIHVLTFVYATNGQKLVGAKHEDASRLCAALEAKLNAVDHFAVSVRASFASVPKLGAGGKDIASFEEGAVFIAQVEAYLHAVYSSLELTNAVVRVLHPNVKHGFRAMTKKGFRVSSGRGRAVLDYTPPEGPRVRVALDCPYAGPKRATKAERAVAFAAAEAKFIELTVGRVVATDPVIKTTMTLSELYAMYVDQFEPPESADENTRKKMRATLIVRRAYGANVVEWATDEAKRPDGTLRWPRADKCTPLQRICADPDGYLLFRLTQVMRVTMRKEKSNLVAFFLWAKANGYVTSAPAVSLPSGGGRRSIKIKKSGRGVDIQLADNEAARLVAVLPEWSSKPSRAKGAKNPKRFRVRDRFAFMWLTGLRPATLDRLMKGRGKNWMPGQSVLTLKNADDKAFYGRQLPLSAAAVEILERCSPKSDGHIFGHHDYRRFVRKAAAVVLDGERAELFGSYHLRHGFGTFLASRTTNTAAGMYMMGHKEPDTFGNYVHPRQQEATALVKSISREQAKLAGAAAKWAQALTKRRPRTAA